MLYSFHYWLLSGRFLLLLKQNQGFVPFSHISQYFYAAGGGRGHASISSVTIPFLFSFIWVTAQNDPQRLICH